MPDLLNHVACRMCTPSKLQGLVLNKFGSSVKRINRLKIPTEITQSSAINKTFIIKVFLFLLVLHQFFILAGCYYFVKWGALCSLPILCLYSLYCRRQDGAGMDVICGTHATFLPRSRPLLFACVAVLLCDAHAPTRYCGCS